MPRLWIRPFIAAHNDELRASRQDRRKRRISSAKPTRRNTVKRLLTLVPHARRVAQATGARVSVSCIMRILTRSAVVAAIFTALLCLCLANIARAEWRMFIVANDPDGYGIDRCLAGHEKCGEPAANAYCKAQDYAKANSFRKVDREDITGAIPAGGSGACRGSHCSIVAIICTR